MDLLDNFNEFDTYLADCFQREGIFPAVKVVFKGIPELFHHYE